MNILLSLRDLWSAPTPLSHEQYLADMNAPETKEALTDIARFFDKHLGR
jgi:hypothetical protein